MMQSIARFAMAVGLGLAGAVVLALQAASAVIERKSPETAVALNPFNGLAREQAAFLGFRARAKDPAEFSAAATKMRSEALAAYSFEPLAPKALTLLALSTANMDKRSKLLELATRLNRRDLSLQIAVLENQLARMDEPGAIVTIDRLLRVHTDYSEQFFAPLQEALLNPATADEFAALLNGSARWHNAFALRAVRDEAARVRLAQIRKDIKITDERFDRQLIAGLAAQGELDLAGRIYRLVAKSDDSIKQGVTTLSWRGDYPPFDWEYLDQKDIRAQPSANGKDLELFVRPGQGAVVAKRVVPLGAGANRRISFKIDSTRPIVAGRMRMAIFCNNGTAPTAELELSEGENIFTPAQTQAECRTARLEIFARTYRAEPVLRANIGQIRLD